MSTTTRPGRTFRGRGGSALVVEPTDPGQTYLQIWVHVGGVGGVGGVESSGVLLEPDTAQELVAELEYHVDTAKTDVVADLQQNLNEHREEWALLRANARSNLAGHQAQYPMGMEHNDRLRFPLCECSGCAIHRSTRTLLDHGAIDLFTGRVKPAEQPDQEVPF